MTQDWSKLAGDLERLLKLRSLPFGMKLFEYKAEMEAIPAILPRPGCPHPGSGRGAGGPSRMDYRYHIGGLGRLTMPGSSWPR